MPMTFPNVATKRGPMRVVGLGDSNCFGQGNTPWSSFYEAVVAQSGGKLIGVKNAGVGGNTSAQITERIVRDVLSYKPDVILLETGTNDSLVAGNILPYITNDINVVLGDTRETLLVVCSTYPQSTISGTALAAQIAALVVAAGNVRIIFADTCNTLTNPATGFLNAIYNSGDGIHVNHAGGMACGQTILTALAPQLANVSPAAVPIVPTSSVIYPVINGTFPANTNGFSVDNGGVGSWVVSDPGITGGYFRSTFAAGTFGNVRFTPPATVDPTPFAGRRCFVSGKVRIQSAATSYSGLGQTNPVVARPLGGANIAGSFSTLQTFGSLNEPKWLFFYDEFDVPPATVLATGAQNLFVITAVVGGTVTVDLAEVQFGVVPDFGMLFERTQPPVSVAVSANITLTTQTSVAVDASGGARTVTLPAVASAVGPVAVFKSDASVNIVTVAPAAGTINGAATVALTALQYAGMTFYPSGANWLAK